MLLFVVVVYSACLVSVVVLLDKAHRKGRSEILDLPVVRTVQMPRPPSPPPSDPPTSDPPSEPRITMDTTSILMYASMAVAVVGSFLVGWNAASSRHFRYMASGWCYLEEVLVVEDRPVNLEDVAEAFSVQRYSDTKVKVLG
jgi:hypothetical protein